MPQWIKNYIFDSAYYAKEIKDMKSDAFKEEKDKVTEILTPDTFIYEDVSDYDGRVPLSYRILSNFLLDLYKEHGLERLNPYDETKSIFITLTHAQTACLKAQGFYNGLFKFEEFDFLKEPEEFKGLSLNYMYDPNLDEDTFMKGD